MKSIIPNRFTVIAVVLLYTVSVSVWANEEDFVNYRIPSGNALKTLMQFAKQSNQGIVFQSSEVQDVQTNEVVGKKRPSEALEIMLSETPLGFIKDDEVSAIAIFRKKQSYEALSSEDSGGNPKILSNTNPKHQEVNNMKVKKRKVGKLLSGLLGLLMATGSPNLTAQTSNSDDPLQDEDIYELSPFEINASEDRGYDAQSTLSGTRLNTSTKDVGVTMTIMTEQFMDDLAFDGTESLLDFTPGSERINSQVSEGPTGQVYWAENMQIRGVRVDSIARNQFASKITGDAYNASRFEFSRGGNSILFGIGNPAGIVNRYTDDAIFSNTNRYRFKIDDNGGARHSLNVNRVLIEDKLSARVAVMQEKGKNWIKPLFNNQKRAYLALNYKALDNLTLKFRAEYFDQTRSVSSGGLNRDAVSVFENAALAAGNSLANQAVIHDFTVSPSGDGIQNYSGGDTLVFQKDASGTQLVNWRNKAIGAEREIVGNKIANVSEDLIPRDWNIAGNSSFQDFEGYNLQAVAQWKVNDKIDIELAVNEEDVIHDFYIQWGSDILRVDASSTLGDGVTPNPNAGRYFSRSDTSWRKEIHHNLTNIRLTGSFQYDFAKEHSQNNWLSRLGSHNVAVLLERADALWLEDSLWLTNLNTQGTGMESIGGGYAEAPHNGWNGTNIIRFINYLDIDSKKIYGTTDPRKFQSIANQYPGINAQWIPSYNSIRGQVKQETIDSFLGVIQSRFWDERIVTTFGWREDHFDIMGGDIVQNPDGPDGWALLAKDVQMSVDEIASAPSPDTTSKGINFHALRTGNLLSYLTFYAQESTTFSNNANGETPLRDPLDSMTGLTRNWGVKFGLFGNKVSGVFTMFDVTLENQPSNSFAPWIELDLLGQAHGITIWEGINPSNTRDTRDLKSEGWEMQLTANITDNWRLMVSYDHYQTKFSNVAPILGDIFDEYSNTFLSDPDINVRPDGEPLTAQEAYDQIYFSYLEFKAQEGRRTQNERSDKIVLVTAYDFKDGALKGLSFGADLIWQSEALTGYQLMQLESGNWVPNPDKPFFGEDLTRLGAHVSYNKKLFKDRIDWKIQLNIRNIGGIDPYVIRHGAESSAPSIPVPWYTDRGRPTQYVLTNTFSW